MSYPIDPSVREYLVTNKATKVIDLFDKETVGFQSVTPPLWGRGLLKVL